MQKKVNLQAAKQWATEISQGFSTKQIVLLSGELGVGKTQWVQFMVAALGATGAHSPTYSVINDYTVNQRRIVHVDLYRLNGEDEVASVGFWDIFAEPGIVLIEWPERIQVDELPLDWDQCRIDLQKTAVDDIRLVTVNFTRR